MNRGFIILFILAALAMPLRAFALNDVDEGYAKPTFREMVRTIVSLGGFDINDHQIADEYARIIYPNLYKENFNNDVAWNKIRQQIVSRILDKREYFRVLYETTNVFKLGRYDFESQSFPLVSNMDTKHVGAVILYQREEYRPTADKKSMASLFPKDVVMLTDRALTVTKLDVPVDKVEKIMTRIQEAGNPDRQIYGRIRVHVTGASGLVTSDDHLVRGALKGDIVSIDFFIDQDMTKPIGSVKIK